MSSHLNLTRDCRPENENLRVDRAGFIAPKVVFVDGLPGCGKTMLSPIIGALPRVELIQYAYEIEYMCALHHLGKASEDVAQGLTSLFSDLKLYNVMMGRETNFRFSDISGVFRNANPWKYLLRLFQKGDEAVLPRIEKDRPILHLTTHHVLPFGMPIFSALQGRGVLIEVVRHPLYMIRQQSMNQERYGKDPRMFTLCFNYQGHSLPYFAKDWEEKFLQSNPVERSIYMIEKLWKLAEDQKQKLKNSSFKYLEIPFETFVVDPWDYMNQVESLLDTTMNKSTHRAMKKQKVPRQKIADAPVLAIYKKYGWKKPIAHLNEAEELKERRKEFAQKAGSEAMNVLDQLSTSYEEKYFKKGVLSE